MSKLVVRLMSAGLVLGIGAVAVPAIAQESGVANTAEDFKSVDGADGFLGSGEDVWGLFHRVNSAGAGVADDSFYRSQSRRINTQAESLRERQRAILEQSVTPAADSEVAPGDISAE